MCDVNNHLKLKKSYDAYDLCDLIHTESAEVLAEYRDDFYAGFPALTVNTLGQGKAYYIATRVKEPFYDDFYSQVIEQVGIKRALKTNLPQGVTAQLRTSGENEYIFLLNFSDKEQEIPLHGALLMDMSSAKIESVSVHLPVHGVKVLKRAITSK